MLTKVTRNDLDEQVKTELDGLDSHIDSVEVKADQGLAENDAQDTKIAEIEADITTINDVIVKSVEGIFPDENGNVDLGATESVVRSVNNQQPDGLGNVIIDDTSIPVINPYTGTQSMLNATLTTIKDSTVRTVDGNTPDTNGNVTLSGVYLGKTAKASDSEKLDGVDSSSFLRSDAVGTMTKKLTLTGGLVIDNADFKIMNVSAPLTTTDHEVLLTDDTTGQVYREAQANMNVGYATSAGNAASADTATNAGTLDGIDSSKFARQDTANTFEVTQTIKGGFHANQNLQGASKNFILDSSTGYTHLYAPSSNAAMYMKKTNSGSQYYATNNSTLRLGDVAIHLNDVEANRLSKEGEPNFYYRQQSPVDFGVSVKPNVEGENCIFLLDVIEKLYADNKELSIALDQVKARLDAAGI